MRQSDMMSNCHSVQIIALITLMYFEIINH